jgi:hypothetical protein
MTSLVGDGRIDPALTASDDEVATALPSAVAARIHLDSGLLQGAIPSHAYRRDLFQFKGNAAGRVPHQALTDTVEWILDADAGAVVIEVVPVAGGATRRLLMAPSVAPHRLSVSNLPAESGSPAHADHGMSDEEMAALHFGAYYKLLMNEPTDKPLPEVWRDRRGAGNADTALCPPAMFTRR